MGDVNFDRLYLGVQLSSNVSDILAFLITTNTHSDRVDVFPREQLLVATARSRIKNKLKIFVSSATIEKKNYYKTVASPKET